MNFTNKMSTKDMDGRNDHPTKARCQTKTLLIMKFTALMLLVACLQVSARSTAQEKITLSVKNASLAEVFQSIEKQSGYVVWYEKKLLTQANPVTVQITNAPVEKALLEVLKNQPLNFTISGKAIVITPKNVLAQSPKAESVNQSTVDISGKVTNDKGEPLVDASIQIKGTNQGTKTGKDGSFTIGNVAQNAVLVVTYTGYTRQEIKLNAETFVSIVLKVSTNPLDAVQVIAYGTTTQRYNVGSVTTVTKEDIASQPVSNPLQALEGRVPGLLISQTSGVPGAAIKIQIRGQNSLATNPNASILPFDNPLFIVDGVPFATQNTSINQYSSMAASGGGNQFGNPYGGLSPFNMLNPADIESIEVLRDADATAIYGSRGANGVVLITTKKGKPGKTSFSMNVSTGQSQATRTMAMMNTQQYLAMRREAFRNDNLTPNASTAPDLTQFDSTSYTDWKDYFLGGKASATDANASISGGNSNTQFYFGTGYRQESYIFPGGFKDRRFSINTGSHHNSNDQRFQLDFSVNYSYERNNLSGQPNVLLAFTQAPNYPKLIDDKGNLIWSYNGISLSNPLAYLRQKYTVENLNLVSHFQIAYQVFNGLTLRTSFGYSAFSGKENNQLPIVAQNPVTNPVGNSNFGTSDFKSWIIEPQAEYKKAVGNGRLNILIGGTFQKNNNASTSVYGTGYINDALLGSLSAAGSISQYGDAYSLYKYSAFFGRINYIWKNRYIINMTDRVDGSSRFGPGRQFGNFSSVAGGWLFSEESFMKKSIPIISYGKLRASYGTTGSDGIGDYQYISNWAPTTESYNGTVGYTPRNLFNPDFSWSINKKLEAGMELGILKDRILANVTWFRNQCGNQLVSYPLPSQTGFNSVTQNFKALIQNSGWEIQVTTKNIANARFSWTTSFNLTIPKNRLISFPGIETSGYAFKYIVGQSVNVLQKIKYSGVNDTTGVFQFYTAKGGLTYTPRLSPQSVGGDYQVIGNLDPKFYGGFRNTFSFKGLQLDIFAEFRKQFGPNYLQQIYSFTTVGYLGRNLPVSFLDRWKKIGDQASIEKLTSKFSGSPAANVKTYFVSSSGAYSDASFIRIKTIALSYSFDSRSLQKIKVQGCRIYINAQNLFTITNYKGNDPETMSFFSMPPLKTVVAGLQFTF